MNLSVLIQSILKGQWAIEPRFAEGYSEIVMKILDRDWDGWKTQDLSKAEGRSPIPILLLSESGQKILADYPGNDPDQNDDNCNPFDNAPEGSTAVIPLKGAMMKNGTMCQYGTTEIAELIKMAAQSKNISSIILDVDSGGGSVDSVAPIIDALNNCDKPKAAIVDLCASAAYWMASACDKIFALNDISSEIGSIGVMMSFADMKPAYEKMGVKFHTIYAPESSFKNKPFEEALKGKYQDIQSEQLSPLAKRFQDAVKMNRGSKLNIATEGILEGKLFFARDAKNCGLIDEIGSMNTALQYVQDAAKIKDLQNSNYKF